ncbi:hypothetical protein N0V90_004466 [Kalmusia sp. IMI 367209]|nr:hypothetical protein N0V90_004466 [Kalmusia sp. IMI 367209]
MSLDTLEEMLRQIQDYPSDADNIKVRYFEGNPDLRSDIRQMFSHDMTQSLKARFDDIENGGARTTEYREHPSQRGRLREQLEQGTMDTEQKMEIRERYDQIDEEVRNQKLEKKELRALEKVQYAIDDDQRVRIKSLITKQAKEPRLRAALRKKFPEQFREFVGLVRGTDKKKRKKQLREQLVYEVEGDFDDTENIIKDWYAEHIGQRDVIRQVCNQYFVEWDLSEEIISWFDEQDAALREKMRRLSPSNYEDYAERRDSLREALDAIVWPDEDRKRRISRAFDRIDARIAQTPIATLGHQEPEDARRNRWFKRYEECSSCDEKLDIAFRAVEVLEHEPDFWRGKMDDRMERLVTGFEERSPLVDVVKEAYLMVQKESTRRQILAWLEHRASPMIPSDSDDDELSEDGYIAHPLWRTWRAIANECQRLNPRAAEEDLRRYMGSMSMEERVNLYKYIELLVEHCPEERKYLQIKAQMDHFNLYTLKDNEPVRPFYARPQAWQDRIRLVLQNINSNWFVLAAIEAFHANEEIDPEAFFPRRAAREPTLFPDLDARDLRNWDCEVLEALDILSETVFEPAEAMESLHEAMMRRLEAQHERHHDYLVLIDVLHAITAESGMSGEEVGRRMWERLKNYIPPPRPPFVWHVPPDMQYSPLSPSSGTGGRAPDGGADVGDDDDDDDDDDNDEDGDNGRPGAPPIPGDNANIHGVNSRPDASRGSNWDLYNDPTPPPPDSQDGRGASGAPTPSAGSAGTSNKRGAADEQGNGDSPSRKKTKTGHAEQGPVGSSGEAPVPGSFEYQVSSATREGTADEAGQGKESAHEDGQADKDGQGGEDIGGEEGSNGGAIEPDNPVPSSSSNGDSNPSPPPVPPAPTPASTRSTGKRGRPRAPATRGRRPRDNDFPNPSSEANSEYDPPAEEFNKRRPKTRKRGRPKCKNPDDTLFRKPPGAGDDDGGDSIAARLRRLGRGNVETMQLPY